VNHFQSNEREKAMDVQKRDFGLFKINAIDRIRDTITRMGYEKQSDSECYVKNMSLCLTSYVYIEPVDDMYRVRIRRVEDECLGEIIRYLNMGDENVELD